MNSWINFSALWQIVVVGIICGAGLPALFAIGLRVLSQPRLNAAPAGPDSDTIVAAGPVGIAIAGACFAVVLAAIGWGIYLIVAGS